MAKLLAIEWDDREARVAVGSPRGSDIVVEEAFAIDISAVTATGDTDDSAAVGQRIAEVLRQRGLTGSDALVGLGRTSIELRSLTLPPAPPDERPDMVRFQAMQAFTTIGEDWPLDFVELGSQDESINVLAAVVSPKQVEQIQQVCAASQLKARCLVLRPFAAASLLNRSQVLAAGRSALVIDLLADGADLTATSQGQVVFMRTVRMPATDDRDVLARSLVGEARRTVAAAQAQMGGQRIEQVIICGRPDEHPILVQSLTEALALDVVVFDPFQAVSLARALEQQLPPDSGRYAPLLGMLADDAAGVRHAIDFLNPRRRPVARSNRRRTVIIASTAAGVAGLMALAIWGGLKRLDNQIAQLQEHSAALGKEVAEAEKLVAKANAIKEFTDTDVTWLDEIREVARRIPDADHLLLREVHFTTDLKRGAIMTLKGNVKSSDVIAQLEDSLRYGANVVTGRKGTIDRNQREYPYNADTSIALAPDKYDGGRSLGRPIREQMLKDTVQPPVPPKSAGKKKDEDRPAPESVEPSEGPPEAKPKPARDAKTETTDQPSPPAPGEAKSAPADDGQDQPPAAAADHAKPTPAAAAKSAPADAPSTPATKDAAAPAAAPASAPDADQPNESTPATGSDKS
jgi:Tfp pilus assembly PilM family ATPase